MPKVSVSGFLASLQHEVKIQIPVKSIATLVLVAAITGLVCSGCGGGSTSSPSGSILNPPTQNVNPTGAIPRSVAVDPTGRFAYVADSNSNNVSMYTIDPVTGILQSVGTIAAGTFPSSVTVDPSGKFAYVANLDSKNVSMYTINPTSGALTSIGTVATGLGPNSIAIHPSGKFAYVVNQNSNNVSMYGIDAATGALTLIGTIGT